MKLKQSRKTMKASWNPVDRFEIFHKRSNAAIIFAAFSENNISAGNALNLHLNVMLKTGVFQVQYE